MERVTFQASGVAGNVFGAFLPIRNCCDTTVILSQLETSRPRGSERVAFMAFGNLRSFIRYGWLVLGKLDHFTAPATGYCLHLFRKEISNVKVDHFRHNIIPSTRTRQSCYAPIPRDAPVTIAVFFSGKHSFCLKGRIPYTTAIRPEMRGQIYWTMVSIDTFGSFVSAKR
jgi:hypothetical protein